MKPVRFREAFGLFYWVLCENNEKLAVFGAFLSFISSAVGWCKNQGLRVWVEFF